ncbi:MAG: GAP family protein [Gammaproteobacteria bacterium]
MSTLLALLTPIALLNSIAKLPGGLAGVVTSLATPKPFLTASAYIFGKFVPFFVVGLLIAIGLDAAFDQTRSWARDIWQDPTGFIVVLQLVIGAAMVIVGYRFSRASHYQNHSKTAVQMTPIGAFSIGAGMTLIGLPGALFYFAAIDLILRAELPVPGIVKAILFYNLVYLSPLMLVVLSRRLFGEHVEPLFRAIAGFFDRWGTRLVFFGLLGLGALLVADAIGWFFDLPLLPSYLR